MRASSLVHALLLWTLSAAAVATGTRADEPPASDSARSLKSAAGEPEPPDPPGYRAAVEHALAELGRGHFSEARAMFLRAHEMLATRGEGSNEEPYPGTAGVSVRGV